MDRFYRPAERAATLQMVAIGVVFLGGIGALVGVEVHYRRQPNK
jgi:hypothetical protein